MDHAKAAITTQAVGSVDRDIGEIVDFFPIPAFIVSPSFRIQRVSSGLLRAWQGGTADFLGKDLFVALYQGSPTARFDRISLDYAIEKAVRTRALCLCHAAYIADGPRGTQSDTAERVTWSARIIPIFREDELLCFVFEWERADVHNTFADGALPVQSWLPMDDAFRMLVQAVKDYAIFLLDTRGNVLTWNPGAELNKGYKREEIVGKHFSLFYGAEDLRSGKPVTELEVCVREGRVEDEGWRYRKDGSRFWANVIITAIYKDGVHVGFGKVTRNLTERKEAEMRLITAYEESAKFKNEFLANMSHEIRTPMHGMLSACTLLLDTAMTEEQREMANIIEESGGVLRQVIDDILDYSKLVSGDFSINMGTVEVASITSSVLRNIQTVLQPEVQLKVTLAADLPKRAVGDPLRYRQILQNIVGNAAKFTERGSIVLHASLLAEESSETSYTVLTEVIDTGPGVSEHAVHILFKPFTQLDTTFQKRHQGTGLGLSIAKSLVELMNGEIGYRPNPEQQGSIFWFKVRLEKVSDLRQAEQPDMPMSPADTAQPSPVSWQADGSEGLQRLREIARTKYILMAEDNIVNQKVLVGMLRGFGLQHITVVSDGAEAVSKVSKGPCPYDLVLMDISMPVMDGYEATTQIRASRGRHLPIVAMTAFALKGDMELCLEKGMDDYIAKPVNRQVLLKKLLKWLQRPVDSDQKYVVRTEFR